MQIPKEKKWIVHDKIPLETDQALGKYPKGLRQLLYNRQIYEASQAELFLNQSGSIFDPLLLTNMDKVISRIKSALEKNELVAVYGDYDVDGITATTILLQALQKIGLRTIAYIPDRFQEGYGLNTDAAESLAREGVNLIFTVDCGIRSVEEVIAGNQLGVDFIISDHHEPGSDLPPAFAVINPKQSGDLYPEKNLAGVGIAFKIIEALAKDNPDWGLIPEEYLDLVAVGTISDIVPLVGENRCLVKSGLKELHKTKRIGLRSLASVAGLGDLTTISARDVGFMIGPRLNAAGRLESARQAFDLLSTNDHQKVINLAQKLDDLNRKRQRLIASLEKIAEEETQKNPVNNLIFAVSDQFHQGVVGLVASRLCDTYYLPSIVGQQKEEVTVASCRSIPEFHITDALSKCADLFEKYGGHHMAAGFTIKNEKLPELVSRLQEIASEELANQELQPVLHADMELYLRQLPDDILEGINKIEPTGQENPDVVFISRNVTVLNRRRVGADKRHLSLTVSDNGKTYRAIAFKLGHMNDLIKNKIDIMYSVKANYYNGQTSTQLHIQDIKIPGQS